MTEITKLCPACEQTLPLESFSPDSKSRGGRRRICRPCDNIRRYGGCTGKGALKLWPEERLRQLEELLAVKPPLKAAEIAERLGCTRNAVIGRIYRMNRKDDSLRDREPWPEREPHPLEKLTHRQCHFPIGDEHTADLHYCGEPVDQPGSAWCEHHRALVYRPTREVESVA